MQHIPHHNLDDIERSRQTMTLLEAWGQSEVGTASYDYNGVQITVMCTRDDQLTVIMGISDPKPFTPEDFGDFCRILGIDPAQNWQPVTSYAVGI